MSEKPIEVTAVPCPVCGHPIPIGETYCANCDFGTPSNRKGPPVSVFVHPEPPEPKLPEPAIQAPQTPNYQHKPTGEFTHPCPNCGRTLPNGTSYCASCGVGARPFSTAVQTPAARNISLIVLGFLLCPLGVCGSSLVPSEAYPLIPILFLGGPTASIILLVYGFSNRNSK